jgi:hypothetical protein
MEVRDIEGNVLAVGDEVYYAIKRGYKANGKLIKCTITGITDRGMVSMGQKRSTSPSDQLIKIK